MHIFEGNQVSKEFSRFFIVGAVSTVINYGIFFLLFSFMPAYYIASSAIGYFSGLIFGYFFNRSWTFAPVLSSKTKEFLLYFSVYIFSLILGLAFLKILVEAFSLSPLIGNVLAIGLTTLSNFFGCKFLVFHGGLASQLKRIIPYFSSAFWVILVIKAISGSLFASVYATEGFLPFLSYFSTTFSNPYQHFLHTDIIPFPYPSGMLFILSTPFILANGILSSDLFQNAHVQLFLMRLPILVFDVLLYVVLCHLLPTKEKRVLWLYFASPILFYINYFHGQLDVIPTSMLFLSLLFLFRKKELASFLLLGLGIATKTHLAAALPFYALYLYRNQAGFKKIAGLTSIAAVAFLFANPYIFSQGFVSAVFNNPEQQRLFSLFVPFVFKDLRFFLAPAALLLIFYRFSFYKRLNTDSLLLVLGLVYTVLIALVPPMPGWFYWSLPFLILFFVKFKDISTVSLWAMNGFFLLYFIFTRDSDIFQSIAPTFSYFSSLPPPYYMLARLGITDASVIENIFFTALEASLLMSIFLSYKMGVLSNELYQGKKKSFIVGIGGDSGVGKSTLAQALEKIVGVKNLVCLDGDDVHKWERGDPRWQTLTHLNPMANFMHTDLEHAVALASDESVHRVAYSHATGKFMPPKKLEANKFIVFQGLLPFVLERMRELYDFKIFIETDEDLRILWKMKRDQNERGYALDKVKEQIDRRKPDADKFIHPQRDFADWIIKYSLADNDGGVRMEYRFRNSIAVDGLVDELSGCSGVRVEQNYPDMNMQQVVFTGTISRKQVEEIAYKLFPNMFDLVENQPEFESDLSGVNQLFFINYLNNFYKQKIRNAHLF